MRSGKPEMFRLPFSMQKNIHTRNHPGERSRCIEIADGVHKLIQSVFDPHALDDMIEHNREKVARAEQMERETKERNERDEQEQARKKQKKQEQSL